MSAARPASRGLAAVCAAFTIWGLFPVYFHPLSVVPAIQVVAHRFVWSCLFLMLWMFARGELGRLATIFATPALLSRLALTAFLISTNWLVYVWAVTHGHIVETSLGYYINPLVNVALGVFVLRERLNGAQWTAIALAALAVTYLALLAGRPPWIAFTVALCFSLYGLLRKVMSVDALPGLATETLLVTPLALAYLIGCETHGSAVFSAAGAPVALLLIGSGLVTAVPLFLFAHGARLIAYSTVGVLQYLAPCLQLASGVLLYHESYTRAMALGYAVLWMGLLIFAADGFFRARRALVSGAAAAAPAAAMERDS